MKVTAEQLNRIENEINEIEPGNNSEQPGSEQQPGGMVIPVEDIIFQLETIGNDYLKQIHQDLGYDEKKIKIHAEMLSVVLKKYFPDDVLKNSPEYLLLAYSGLLAAEGWNKYKNLQEQGSITVKSKNQKTEKSSNDRSE